MVRVIICCGAMIAIIVGLRWGFGSAIDTWGLGWGALLVAVFLGVILFISHQIDRRDGIRSQEVLPPTPPDYR